MPVAERSVARREISAGDLLQLEEKVRRATADRDASAEANDRPIRRGRLGHGVARAAGVFRTRDAQHAELGWNPVQHLADALANAVQDTSTARTSVVRHVDHDLFARQMIGQRACTVAACRRSRRLRAGCSLRRVRYRYRDLPDRGRVDRDRGARNGGRTASAEAV